MKVLRISTRCERGFTLIELLVAISVVALLSVLLFGGLRFAIHGARSVDRRTDDAAKVALAYDFMQRVLTDARPLPVAPSDMRSTLQFDGKPQSIGFVALPPPHVGLGGFLSYRLSLEGSGPSRRLAVSWSPFRRGFSERGSAMQRPSVLIDGVRSVRFAYFGVTVPNRPPNWTDRWITRKDLPRLIRMRVVLDDGWSSPDLIVAPRLGR